MVKIDLLLACSEMLVPCLILHSGWDV